MKTRASFPAFTVWTVVHAKHGCRRQEPKRKLLGMVYRAHAIDPVATKTTSVVAVLEARGFWRLGRIECGLLSGLVLRLSWRPQADMEISMIGSKSIQRAAGLVAPNWFSHSW